jgi:thioredoxin-related protein
MQHWMFNCRDISQKVSESMDRSLPLHHRMLITVHLLMCQYCNRFKQQMMSLRNAVRLNDLPQDETDPTISLSKETRNRIKQSLKSRLSQD